MRTLRSGLAALATAVVATTATLVSVATPAAAAACAYAAEPLALPAGVTSAFVTATDGRTAFAGPGTSANGRQQFVVWRDGVPEGLPPVGGSLNLTGINAQGDLIGSWSAAPGVSTPEWYHAGVRQPSGVFGNESPSLDGINAAGDIVGRISRNGVQKVAVWRAGHQAEPPVVLSTPDGFFPTTPRIGDDGSVAIFGLIGADAHAFVWAPDGTRRTLATPLGGEITRVSSVRGTRIIGSALGFGAVEWDLSGALASTPGTETTEGLAVTSAGTVLMSYRKPGEQTTVPVVATPGATWQYLPAPAGSSRAVAGTITDAGVVGGSYVDTATGKTVPVRWKCAS
ncbi:hypothetical protein GCM10027598_08520 [Amycolatopsis oliviviridis]|uniref:Uncharacterized protein n=1 Tax=Amycolatopsis oliviviridis TaxID=1471590 RepID=A0ABQ3LQI3_9PSEU|nr:hypothetical protein [Amycolatopsis oliviviridis]GHH21183.1 hypothetical protein GCM10017790_41930 [Amycolatopsis oliviviridis]